MNQPCWSSSCWQYNRTPHNLMRLKRVRVGSHKALYWQLNLVGVSHSVVCQHHFGLTAKVKSLTIVSFLLRRLRVTQCVGFYSLTPCYYPNAVFYKHCCICSRVFLWWSKMFTYAEYLLLHVLYFIFGLDQFDLWKLYFYYRCTDKTS